MKHFIIEKLGPIEKVDVNFGDLTILVGAQASGKSIFLQLLKLVEDREHIIQSLENFGFVVKGNSDNILNRYYGEGLSSIWTDDTKVLSDGHLFSRNCLERSYVGNPTEKVFYIPAQRILSIADGRPKYFMEFSENDPYVLRKFSEILRLFLQSGLGGSTTLYPLPNRLKNSIKRKFDEAIFHGGTVVLDERSGQRKIAMDIDNMHLPLMTWSAGQKEFMPLLMAFYCLSGPPQNVVNRDQYEYIVLEEPEMGLHPLAIQTIILQLIEFVHAGYNVIVSTHSPVILEFVWAYNYVKSIPSQYRLEAMKEIFGLKGGSFNFINGLFEKNISTYYFSRKDNKVISTNISSLDASSEDVAVNEWGGLTQFSSLANDVVAKFIARYGK